MKWTLSACREFCLLAVSWPDICCISGQMVLTPKLGTDGVRHQMNGEEIVLDGNYFVFYLFIAQYSRFSVAFLEIIYMYLY